MGRAFLCSTPRPRGRRVGPDIAKSSRAALIARHPRKKFVRVAGKQIVWQPDRAQPTLGENHLKRVVRWRGKLDSIRDGSFCDPSASCRGATDFQQQKTRFGQGTETEAHQPLEVCKVDGTGCHWVRPF